LYKNIGKHTTDKTKTLLLFL